MSTLRGYLSPAQYTAITGETLAGDGESIINRAEAIIDGLLGYWQPAIGAHFKGVARAGSTTSMQLSEPDTQSSNTVNYLKGCIVEFLTGDNAGKFVVINSQDSAGSITFDALDTAISVGDVYHVYQMGKVPRAGTSDVMTLVDGGVNLYVKTIPAALREAVAWQVKYMQSLGDAYFDGIGLNMDSESIGGYSYTKSDNAKGARAIIAPKARQALSGTGLINRGASIVGY